MTENVHTVKILDLIVSDSMTDIFMVMNYVEHDLCSVLGQKDPVIQKDHTETRRKERRRFSGSERIISGHRFQG